jgi:hypothetical protein
MLWVLHRLINEQTSHSETADAGLTAVVSVLDAAGRLFGDPMLLPESTATAVAAAVAQLDTLPAVLSGDPANRTLLLLAAGAAVVTIAECALAAEAFEPITVAADVLERSAAALRREADKTLRHLGVRLRLAITEARSPLGADDAGWEELQRKATGWKLDDRDAALVLSRYARTRAWAGAFADALTMDKDTVVWTDEPHLRMLVAIAAAEDDDSASAAFSRISRLFAVESPALRGARQGPGSRSSATP